MKKIILTIALFAQLSNLAKADTAINIDVSTLASSASLEVVIYAHDVNTHELLAQTMPISVSASSGNVTIQLDDISWNGAAPTGDWGWGYAEVSVSCSVPSTAASPVLCGSLNLDGVTVGNQAAVNQDCFEVATTSCSSGLGDDISVKMGNSGNERPSYPAAIEIM